MSDEQTDNNATEDSNGSAGGCFGLIVLSALIFGLFSFCTPNVYTASKDLFLSADRITIPSIGKATEKSHGAELKYNVEKDGNIYLFYGEDVFEDSAFSFQLAEKDGSTLRVYIPRTSNSDIIDNLKQRKNIKESFEKLKEKNELGLVSKNTKIGFFHRNFIRLKHIMGKILTVLFVIGAGLFYLVKKFS